MLENQDFRPAQVIGPLGEPLTLDSLPPPQTSRWVVRRKAEVVAAVSGGLLSVDEACERYQLQFLDDTVSFTRMRLARNPDGALRIARTYTFEFSDTGNNRRQGAIVMLGGEVHDLHLEPYPV